MKKNLTYISLFSGAGVGCYAFKQSGFQCIATVELLEKRLKFQKYNNKCNRESGYILGDISENKTKEKLFNEVEYWRKNKKVNDIDIVIATPPCQGMSVANHKKKDELIRNSLVIQSIDIINKLKPKFILFENVKTFLTTICTDLDNVDKTIGETIDINLGGDYNILTKVINFKDYGVPSSRTRTLVLGVRKDIHEITPYDIFPDENPEINLLESIGHLKSLKNMGEISDDDIFHSYRAFDRRMFDWIKDLKEGESAFDNKTKSKIPHRIINGKIIYNKNKNGDKYKRWFWDRPGPCIHTRNDILASQSTIHPSDNRVFSIRELMKLMSIPDEFAWSLYPTIVLSNLNVDYKKSFLKAEELNIRHSIGEAVPTYIFEQIALKIKEVTNSVFINDVQARKIIEEYKLSDTDILASFIKNNFDFKINDLLKIAEFVNSNRNENSAYYTRQDICFTIIKDLPDFKGKKEINILEPSVGVGNFIPLLIKKYKSIKKVNIDTVDIDKKSLEIFKKILEKLEIPSNIEINFINADFLDYKFEKKYDLIIGNPPFKKITGNKELLQKYKLSVYNKNTNNIFSFFLEKCISIGKTVSLIAPKSLLSTPEFDKTRHLLSGLSFKKINDYGEKAFKGVKIETISFIIDIRKRINSSRMKIESYITNDINYKLQDYVFSKEFPCWLLYRDESFDTIAKKLEFNIFNCYRDRKITKKFTKNKGKYRVLKSRNIASNKVIDIDGYDTFVDNIESFGVSKYINNKNAILVPNLTYNPRACFLPSKSIADGSVAILTLKNGHAKITKQDLSFFSTKTFTEFYMTARNKGTRSLNIDNNSVFFFGVKK